MKKVVFVLPSFVGGGAERVMLKLANALDQTRFDIVFVVLKETGPLRREVGAHIPVISLDRPRVRSAFLPLRRVLKRLSPAFVVTTMGYLNLFVLLACGFGFPGTRFIVREANDPIATLRAFRYPYLIRALYRMLYPRADTVICPSRVILESLAEEFAIPRNRMHVLRNPVDVSTTRQLAAEKIKSGDGVLFVASGRLTEQKGFDRLLDMFAKMPNGMRLIILGDGPLKSPLRKQADKLKILDRVEFAGFQENPWRYYAAADAFVMPSRWEGMPNAALEALACGTPVIATPESGGIGEVAAVAPAGAVRIAAAGEPFVSEMSSVSRQSAVWPRPSLLPDEFRLPMVCRNFQCLMLRDAED